MPTPSTVRPPAASAVPGTPTTPGGDPAGRVPEAQEVLADCVDRQPCEWFLDWTGSETTAEVLDRVVAPLFEVIVVLVLMMLARGLLRRVVGTVVEQMKRPVAPNALHRLADVVDGGHDAPEVTQDRRERRAQSMGALLMSVGSAVIWIIGGMTILGAFGIDLAPLIAGAGIVGIALGFGAQDLVKDFLSGVFMLVEDQYGVGDTVDVGEAAGVVEGISLRTTRIRDVQGRLWHVPNGEIRRVANASQAWARALLDVDIAYGADIDEAIRVIEEAGKAMASEDQWDELFLEQPEVWGVQNLAADSIQLRIVIKTVAGEQFKIGRELRRRIKYALDEADIEIPFQQRTVWLRSDDGTELTLGSPKKKATRKKAASPRATGSGKSTGGKATAKKAATRSQARRTADRAVPEDEDVHAQGAPGEV